MYATLCNEQGEVIETSPIECPECQGEFEDGIEVLAPYNVQVLTCKGCGRKFKLDDVYVSLIETEVPVG